MVEVSDNLMEKDQAREEIAELKLKREKAIEGKIDADVSQLTNQIEIKASESGLFAGAVDPSEARTVPEDQRETRNISSDAPDPITRRKTGRGPTEAEKQFSEKTRNIETNAVNAEAEQKKILEDQRLRQDGSEQQQSQREIQTKKGFLETLESDALEAQKEARQTLRTTGRRSRSPSTEGIIDTASDVGGSLFAGTQLLAQPIVDFTGELSQAGPQNTGLVADSKFQNPRNDEQFNLDQIDANPYEANQFGQSKANELETLLRSSGAAGQAAASQVVRGYSALAQGDISRQDAVGYTSQIVDDVASRPADTAASLGLGFATGTAAGTLARRGVNVDTGALKTGTGNNRVNLDAPQSREDFAGRVIGDQQQFKNQQALAKNRPNEPVKQDFQDSFGFRRQDTPRVVNPDEGTPTFTPELGEEKSAVEVLRGNVPDRKQRNTQVEIVQQDGVITDERTETVSTEGRNRRDFISEEGLSRGRGDAEEFAGREIGAETTAAEKVSDALTNTRKGQTQTLTTKDTATGTRDTVSISDRIERTRDKTRDLVGSRQRTGPELEGRRRDRSREFNKPDSKKGSIFDSAVGAGLGLGTGQQQDNVFDTPGKQKQPQRQEILQENPPKNDDDVTQKPDFTRDPENDVGGIFDPGSENDRPRDQDFFRARTRDRSRTRNRDDEEDDNNQESLGIFSTGDKDTQYRASVGAELIGKTAEKKPGKFFSQNPTNLRPLIEEN